MAAAPATATRWCVLIVLALCAASAHARLYRWVSPDTGITQLSGKPPLWYRSPDGGPRVRVYDDGRLVDDTAVAVPEERRQALRDAAFRQLSEQREQTQALRTLDRAVRRRTLTQPRSASRQPAPQGSALQAAAAQTAPVAAAPPAPTKPAEHLDPATVRQLKALITDWDQRDAGESGQPTGGADSQ
jgi:hypothetical protein